MQYSRGVERQKDNKAESWSLHISGENTNDQVSELQLSGVRDQ